MIKKRLKSFSYAFQGIISMIKEEPNARIHLLATVTMVTLGFNLTLNATEWCLLIFAIGLVLSMEALNSSIESLADFVSPDRHPLIKKVKDIAAAGVLFSALAALVIGTIIFIPKIFQS